MARQAALSVGEKPRHAKGSVVPEHCRGAPLFWEGSVRKDFMEFPLDVQKDMGVALFVVQLGETPPSAKPWKGLGSGVYELVEDHRRGMFRAIYTVKIRGAVHVLHAFQKKSKSGLGTPRQDVDLVEQRLKTMLDRHK
jgi:phage-related protein